MINRRFELTAFGRITTIMAADLAAAHEQVLKSFPQLRKKKYLLRGPFEISDLDLRRVETEILEAEIQFFELVRTLRSLRTTHAQMRLIQREEAGEFATCSA